MRVHESVGCAQIHKYDRGCVHRKINLMSQKRERYDRCAEL